MIGQRLEAVAKRGHVGRPSMPESYGMIGQRPEAVARVTVSKAVARVSSRGSRACRRDAV